MKRFKITGPAKRDLREISQYISVDNPAAALKLTRQFLEAMQNLARHPSIGPPRKEVTDASLRILAVSDYLIIYRFTTNPIEIIRVIHGKRDLRRVLRGK